MKIRLVKDIPVDKRHGLTKGRVFEATNARSEINPHVRYRVTGDDGARISVLGSEAEIVSDNDEPTKND
jgi:hypothetical protein